MPRGRAPGYATQREEILARAAALFARQGYGGTSMHQVAEACGLSKPALYHYVRDKYQLLVEIAEGHVARLVGLVAEVEREGLAPAPRLRRLIERFVQEYASARDAHRVLTEDVRFLEPDDAARVLDGQRRVIAAFADAVAALRPELRPARLDKPLTMLLFGMINWMFTWMRPDGALSHDAMAPLVADLFFGGLPAVQAAPPRPARARLRAPA
jgi:TetR/AcrR family transcriptional regulator